MEAHVCNPNTWRADAGKFPRVQLAWQSNEVNLDCDVKFCLQNKFKKVKLQNDPKTVTYSGLMLQSCPNWV